MLNTTNEIEELRKELKKVKAERDNMIYINSLLRDRPDLKERAILVDKLIKELQSYKDTADKLSDLNKDDRIFWLTEENTKLKEQVRLLQGFRDTIFGLNND